MTQKNEAEKIQETNFGRELWTIICGGVIGFVASLFGGFVAYYVIELSEAGEALLIFVSIFGGPALGIYYGIKKNQAKRARVQQAKEAADERERGRQDSLQRLEEANRNAVEVFNAMPRHLMTADELLDQAEKEFSEYAYSPFWHSVEQAVQRLGEFNTGIKSIQDNGEQFAHNTDLYLKNNGRKELPPFSVNKEALQELTVSDVITTRLDQIVYAALRDHKYATIYEQRRTNTILISGFETVGQAIDQMNRSITHSIDEMNHNLTRRLDQQVSLQIKQLGATERAVDQLRDIRANSETANRSRLIGDMG